MRISDWSSDVCASDLPVVRDGRMVGIVSRADLIQGLAATKAAPALFAEPDDSSIRVNVLAMLRSQPWSNVETSDITVTNGLVEFWGIYRSEAERSAEIGRAHV